MASMVVRPSEATVVPPKAPLKVDREKTCPLLLRVFTRVGPHFRAEDFNMKGREPGEELQVYTWRDATLREITDLIKDVNPSARGNARLNFAFVYPDTRGRMVMRDVGVTIGNRRGPDDEKTLDSLHFETGDYLAVNIIR